MSEAKSAIETKAEIERAVACAHRGDSPEAIAAVIWNLLSDPLVVAQLPGAAPFIKFAKGCWDADEREVGAVEGAIEDGWRRLPADVQEFILS